MKGRVFYKVLGPGLFDFNFSFVHLFILRDRVRQSGSRGGAEREGDTESEAGPGLRAVPTLCHLNRQSRVEGILCYSPDPGFKRQTMFTSCLLKLTRLQLCSAEQTP